MAPSLQGLLSSGGGEGHTNPNLQLIRLMPVSHSGPLVLILSSTQYSREQDNCKKIRRRFFFSPTLSLRVAYTAARIPQPIHAGNWIPRAMPPSSALPVWTAEAVPPTRVIAPLYHHGY